MVFDVKTREKKPNTFINRTPDYSKRIPPEGFGNMMGSEEMEALETVMREKVYTWGRFVAGFEDEFADFIGVKYAYAVHSCTGALEIATKLIGVAGGDEIITTPVTFPATALAPLEEGAGIVFADIDPATYNIDPLDIERKITGKTKAIFVVHLDGKPCDMDPIMELAGKHSLRVVEDCAHAPGGEYKGRKLGSIGDLACFSFHARKNMSTLGEGGMITTNSDQFGEEIPTMRCIGHKKLDAPRVNDFGETMVSDVVAIRGQVPIHSRMSDFQAAVGVVQLRKLTMMNGIREEIAAFYDEELSTIRGITSPVYPEDAKCTHHRYTALYDEKDAGVTRKEFDERMAQEGVASTQSYLPSYLYGIYEERGYEAGGCPNAEEFYKKSMMLPIYPELTVPLRKRVIEAVRKSLQGGGRQ